MPYREPPNYYWNPENNIVFIYRYLPSLPIGTFARLLISLHNYIPNESWAWQNGFRLEFEKAEAEITIQKQYEQIKIRIIGRERKVLLYIILHELDKINKRFANKLAVDRLIPCNCGRYKNKKDCKTNLSYASVQVR